MALTAFYPQESVADGFTGAEFLTRAEPDQKATISTQLVMASTIAARIKPPLSDCIGKTFFDPQGLKSEAFEAIIDRVREFGEYHPSSVILVVIENRCGKFN